MENNAKILEALNGADWATKWCPCPECQQNGGRGGHDQFCAANIAEQILAEQLDPASVGVTNGSDGTWRAVFPADEDEKQAHERLFHLMVNRPTSRLHPSIVLAEEAIAAAIEGGNMTADEAVYFALMFGKYYLGNK